MTTTTSTLSSMPSPVLQVAVDVSSWPEHLRQRLMATIHELQEEASRPIPEDVEPSGWTRELVEHALDALGTGGAPVQAKAIRRAVVNGGTVTRAEVYQLGDYAPQRKLRGFTRPTNRITQGMRDNGLLPEDADELLATQYDPNVKGYQPTTGFSVPPEVVKLLQE